MRRAKLLLFSIGLAALLTGCATSPDLQMSPVAKACQPISVADCLALLDHEKLPAKDSIEVLRELATTYLEDMNPERAIEYLDAAIERNDADAESYQLRGLAFAVKGLMEQKSDQKLQQIFAQSSFLLAATNYLMAIAHDPENEMNYVTAASLFAASGGCKVAKSLGESHEKKFGRTTKQDEIADIIQEKCGG
ncbi:hypothetical protein [Dongia sp.]|uniref:hypothetical protein n=1 Tax=Dongia sp. TaxID=1977262 RepID=UPI0035AE3187